ncbi:type IV inositol polyphosphate 5-phosphatase 11-like isoform X1 [Ananas comosus]|uniref:Type IV inositol polyphosphate 5-phosphatase 11-like isoform X1 n=2 Tax=Ananas comosus TaxID=4615 RepID=A0A6P5GED3_ANACO|nr:type IV inositol polyphosphate 5-phosphatase 11-like isoform X1 [Ananas comosus]
MQSLHLYVLGPKNSEFERKELRVDKCAVGGCGGLIRRKKGAVGVYIVINRIHMVFISCHLSAHAHNVKERNSQWRHISYSLFAKNRSPYATASHVTVWLGDLNYRLHGISTLAARSLIHKNLHSLLTSKDQLLQEAERGQVFRGYYCEGTLSFKPTYKYNVGSSNYDTQATRSEYLSWTDRILFKIDSSSGIDAVLHSYESQDQSSSSHRKPVKAHLCSRLNN